MYSKKRFAALEIMCREHASVAGEDKQFWLNEAEEWARFARSADLIVESPPLQLDLLEHNSSSRGRRPS